MGFWCWSENGDNVEEISQADIEHWRDHHSKETSGLMSEDIAADMYSSDHSLETGDQMFVVERSQVSRFEVSAKAVRIEASTSRLN